MRALLNNFDPIKQVYNRLLSLTLTGHETDKIEMIVLGGTRDVYPEDYKEKFIKHLYDACNTFPDFYARHQTLDKDEMSVQRLVANTTYYETDFPDTVDESIRLNESATHRMIGLTIETRPEYVTYDNCLFWRRLGVTRLEMGIQSTNDDVLEANKR